MSLVPAQRKMLSIELAVSTAINSLIPTAIIWAVDLDPPARLVGETGLISGLLKGSGLATVLMTLAITLLVRGRLRNGVVPPLTRADVPGFARWLPANVILRAVVMGLIAAALLVPIWSGVAAALGLLPLTKAGFALFNIVFGATVGLSMTPAVVLRALADRR